MLERIYYEVGSSKHYLLRGKEGAVLLAVDGDVHGLYVVPHPQRGPTSPYNGLAWNMDDGNFEFSIGAEFTGCPYIRKCGLEYNRFNGDKNNPDGWYLLLDWYSSVFGVHDTVSDTLYTDLSDHIIEGVEVPKDLATQEKSEIHWNQIQETMSHAYNAGLNTLLYGVPGTGKTTAAFNLSKQYQRDYYSITMHSDMSVQELVGSYIPSGVGAWEFRLGPLGTAFKEGYVVSLNELDRASGPVLTCLYGALDDKNVARITTPLGVVRPSSYFYAVGTTNMSPDTMDLPEALLDRFPIRIHVKYPHPKAVTNLRMDALRRFVWEVYEDQSGSMSQFHEKVTFRQVAAIDALIESGMELGSAVGTVIHDSIAREVARTLKLATA